MKAVIPQVEPAYLDNRKRLGHDIWDEVWEGVLHMPPMPNLFHQDFEGDLIAYLRIRWARPRRAKVYHQANLAPSGAGADWMRDYRIPDLSLLTPMCRAKKCGTHLEGPPDAVVEIHSPGDESYEKMDFYRDLGVPEVWIIHRDSKYVELFLLQNGEYVLAEPDAEGWVRSPATGVEMRPTATAKLAVRIDKDDATLEELPVD